MSGTRLGDLMVKESLITPEQLAQALEYQKKNGGRLGSCLIKMGFVNDEDVTTFLSRQYGVPSINLAYFEVDSDVVKLVPEDTARRYEIVPLSRVGSSLTIAMVDPTNVFAMDDIKFMTGFNVEPVVASESSIREAIDRFYAQAQGSALDKVMEEFAEGGEDVLELEATQEELGRRAGKGGGGGPGREAGEYHPPGIGQPRRQRYSHGTLRKGLPRPLPD